MAAMRSWRGEVEFLSAGVGACCRSVASDLQHATRYVAQADREAVASRLRNILRAVLEDSGTGKTDA
jgi:hypothetical protein